MTSESEYLYELRCTVLNADLNTKTVKLNWSFPKFYSQIKKPTYRDICTNKNELGNDDEDYNIQLRLKILGNTKKLIEFYYMLPTKPLYIKSKMFLVAPSSEKSEISSCSKFVWKRAKRWYFLKGQYDEYTCNNKNLNSKVEFEFHFTIDLSDRSKDDTPTQKRKLECTQDEERAKVAKLTLNCSLENMFHSSMFSDITIKCNRGSNIRAHKVILASRSPVLRAHFEHEMAEKLTNVIESPFEEEVIIAMLKYIYSADTLKVNEMPEELFKAADFYQLDELKDICEAVLVEKLAVENVIKTLELANFYAAKSLGRKCLKFINSNNSLSVLNTEGWKELKSLEIVKSIAEYSLGNKYM